MLVRYSRLAASDTVDIKTHSRASPPLPERKLREANYCNILMLLWNVAHSDRLAAIPPKADIVQVNNVVLIPHTQLRAHADSTFVGMEYIC